MLASACGGGAGFTSQGTGQDASVSGGSDGGVVVVVSPNTDAEGPVDAVGESTPAAEPDGGEAQKQGDATADGPSCSPSDLECSGTCVAIDTDNCGACGTKCSAPDGGTPTCNEVNHAYKCDIACSANLTHCGNACVSVQTDSNNCGRCGHGCLAGACVSGQCQSWLVANTSAANAGLFVPRAGRFASNPGGYGWSQMLTDGTNLVWIDVQQGILEVSAKAGPSSPIGNLSPLHGANPVSPANLAMANGVVVWTVSDASSGVALWAASEGQYPSGAMVASLGPNSVGDLPSGLALDSTAANAYFIDSVNSTGTSPQSPGLYKCNLANKSCSVLYAVTVPISFLLSNDLAIGGSRLFWTDSASGSISRADYTSNALGTVVSNQNAPCLLALDATNLYWDSVVLGDAGTPSFSIAATPQASPGAVTSVVSSTSGSLGGMASDGTNLYFIENAPTGMGQLEYIPVNGSSAPQPLKPAQQAVALAVGGGAIYWLNGDDTIDGIAAP
jgi:hypothetical protein